jgi:hypothetical protein
LKEWLSKRTPVKKKTDDKWEKILAESIFYVEMELSQRIDWDYPLLKFLSLLEYLSKQKQKEHDQARK